MTAQDTDADWAAIAETDPYWAVISADAFLGAPSDEALARFFASGEQQVAALFGFVKRHLNEDFAPQRILDFGCGVGRLLLPFARLASEAVGVDIAPRMIALCRENLASAGLHNATVIPGDDDLSAVTGRFDLVNSVIVLQHIPPDRGIQLIARLLDLLALGGIASLQLTYAKERRFYPNEAGRARYFRRDGDALRDLLPVPAQEPPGTIRMFDYDLNQIMLMIGQVAGHPVLALPTQDDGHAGYHFVFSRAR